MAEQFLRGVLNAPPLLNDDGVVIPRQERLRPSDSVLNALPLLDDDGVVMP